jgi:hypothetical protein
MSGDGKWIGVDLDGTLARDDGELWAIGPPVPGMLAMVRLWLAAGEDVQVVTARVAGSGRVDPDGVADDEAFAERQRVLVEAWLLEHVGRVLPVRATKDFMMRALWDDRAVRVIANRGVSSDAVLWGWILGLKRGTCWCEAGVGNPMVPQCSETCQAIAATARRIEELEDERFVVGGGALHPKGLTGQ